MTRFVVVEPGPHGRVPDDAQLVTIAASLTADSPHAVVRGWHQPGLGTSRVVCVGTVRSLADAAEAVSAAVAGARLVIAATADRDVIDQLCDDLRRLGELDHRLGTVSRPVLSDDQRALLAELLGGSTLGQAAQRLHLSRRTADRRLADARKALGAGTTAAALHAAVRLGIRPETHP